MDSWGPFLKLTFFWVFPWTFENSCKCIRKLLLSSVGLLGDVGGDGHFFGSSSDQDVSEFMDVNFF